MTPEQAQQFQYDELLKIERDDERGPLTLEGAVRSCILKNPGMAPWRDDALQIIYCLLGAGISWNKSGRLCDAHPNNYLNPLPNNYSSGRWDAEEHGLSESMLQMAVSDELKDSIVRRNERKIARNIRTLKEIDVRTNQYNPKGGTYWYPISWYGCNLCVPKGAQEDFRLGAIETCQAIIATEIDFGDWQHNPIHAMQTKNYAEEILAAITEKEAHLASSPEP